MAALVVNAGSPPPRTGPAELAPAQTITREAADPAQGVQEAVYVHQAAWQAEQDRIAAAEAARVAREARRKAKAAEDAKRAAAKARASRSASSGGAGGTLAARRACEATGDYGAVSKSGKYRGGYQFDQRSWNSAAKAAGRPDLIGKDPASASPGDQDAMAVTWERVHGGDPWPNCP